MKQLLLLVPLIWSACAFSQNSVIGIPDSAKNIPAANGQVSYVITNPLGYNGNGFTNSPVAVLIQPNNVSNYLNFYDLDLSVPGNATITGVEVTHKHGGCNAGSFTIDSMYLAYNGAIISTANRDSASAFTTNMNGNSSDLWNANLSTAIVNDNSFGIILQSYTTGICTFSQADIQVKVYYSDCTPVNSSGYPDSAANVAVPNGLVSYVVTNPLGHNANGFANTPVAVLIQPNNVSNQLYFYDLDFSVPGNATITGVEVAHKHGGCNSGSYTIDSLFLAYNGSIVSTAKRDSASAFTTNINGGTFDLWAANLTPAMVNDNSFGIILQSYTTGICTFVQSDLEVKVHYCASTNSIASNEQQLDVIIYPNPVESILHVEIAQAVEPRNYKILDYTGKHLLSGTLGIDEDTIDVSSLPSSFYVIQINETNLKFIKK